MKTKLLQILTISTLAITFTACASKTTHQIGLNTYTSSAEQREAALDEAIETCEDLNSEIKVVKERVQKEKIIIDYKCLNIKDKEYFITSPYIVEKEK